MLGALDPTKIGPEMAGQMLALAGIKVGEGGGLPENMAEVNEVMNTLPPELRPGRAKKERIDADTGEILERT